MLKENVSNEKLTALQKKYELVWLKISKEDDIFFMGMFTEDEHLNSLCKQMLSKHRRNLS